MLSANLAPGFLRRQRANADRREQLQPGPVRCHRHRRRRPLLQPSFRGRLIRPELQNCGLRLLKGRGFIWDVSLSFCFLVLSFSGQHSVAFYGIFSRYVRILHQPVNIPSVTSRSRVAAQVSGGSMASHILSIISTSPACIFCVCRRVCTRAF